MYQSDHDGALAGRYQKIMHAMAEREGQHWLDGTVQLDDVCLCGERSGGKAGRGSENKVPFVAAVVIDEQGHPHYLKLAPVEGFTLQEIARWARATLMPSTRVISDGLGCFAAVTAAGCVHEPIVVGARKPRELPQFTWVNTVLGNLTSRPRQPGRSMPSSTAAMPTAASGRSPIASTGASTWVSWSCVCWSMSLHSGPALSG